jgi:hypothetical protein
MKDIFCVAACHQRRRPFDVINIINIDVCHFLAAKCQQFIRQIVRSELMHHIRKGSFPWSVCDFGARCPCSLECGTCYMLK